MKSIIIMTVVLLIALYYIIAEVIWQLRNRIVRRKLIIGVLIAALLASQLDIMSLFMKTDAEMSYAAEAENAEIITVSAFVGLPDEVREQIVPVGTTLDELILPDTLEAVCITANTSPDEPGEGNTEDEEVESEEETDQDEDMNPGEETSDDSENEADPDGESDLEEEADSDGEASDDGNGMEAGTDNPSDDGEVAESGSTEDSVLQAETGSFVMPEYQTENVIEVKTLEMDSGSVDSEGQTVEDSNSDENSETSVATVIIENITWQSEPEYDGDTEGEYIFTAVLPEGYVLTNGVNAPQITVTVGGTNNIMLLSADGSKDNWPRNPYKKEPNNRYMTFDCVYFGKYWYHDTNSDGEVDQSDAKEPIKWRVLSVDESGDAFLLADRIVDAQPYNKTNKSGVTWESCTLRSWLNGYSKEKNGEEDYSGIGNSFFDNAFTAEEKNAIIETEVENGDDPDGKATMDKVYLLSISEVTNPAYGFSASKSSSDGSRVAYSTDYAISANPYYEYHWYLRSMVDKGSSVTPSATLIDGSYGTVEENIYGISVASAMGVRPVLHLDLNKNVWEPACPVQERNYVLHRSFGPWHSHPSWKDYHEHICTDKTCVRLEGPSRSSDWESCSGGTAGYTKRAICTTCGGEYGALLTDDIPPTGTISIDTDQWDDVVSGATFERFYKESKDVTITAADGESGVASISYYLTDRELTKDDLEDIEDWLSTDADYEKEEDWKATDTVRVPIEPDTECILYAKIIDGVGNTTYLSSDGMVFDGTAPKIEGVEAGGTYCAPQNVTVTVTDDYLDSVTLNGESVALSADGTSCTFTLSEAERSLTIKASDKAGNSTTVTVTVKEDHTFGDWEESIGKNRSKTCENCGHKYTETDEERLKAAKEIVEEFLGNLSAPEDMEADELRQMVEDKLAREGFSDVKVTMDEFHKEESSGQKAGKVWGDVTLELREASEDVDFDIPLTNDRQRVQRAKEIVEQTLSEMTVSNDTTAEDIQDAIDAALKDAGLEDVTAKVDDFGLEEATEASEGRITGTVTLEKGKETDEAEIDKKIGKLEQTPGTTPEQTPQASVDRSNGKITGLTPGAKYDITYEDKDGKQHTDTATADENGNLEIKDDWTGGDIDIVKKGNGTNTTDSDEQTLRIPTREKKPAPKTTKVSAKGKSDGKITNLEPDETYEISKDGGKTWETVTANDKGEITGLPAGNYKIRTKAKDNADGGTLCSEAADCKIGTKSSSTGGGSSESGGGNSGGGQSDDNSGGQSDDGSGSGQTDDTPEDSVTPPKDTPKKETPKKGTPKKETPSKEESKKDTGKTQEDSEKTEQSTKMDTKSSEETTDQAASTETSDDTIEITGDPIATGTIKDAENTTTTITVGEGSVSVTVVSDEYSHAAGIKDTVALSNAVLTKEQIRHVNDGGKIEIRVEVKDISDQVSKKDKDIIEKGLAGNKITSDIDTQEQGELILGAYIDISMFMRIGDGDWDAITHAGEPIDVVIGIPDELQDDGRTFYVARCHEGEYALLHDMDTEAETITIQTELFSTYAIVYSQTGIAGITSGSKCNLCHICPTFLGVCCFIWLAIMIVAVIAVILIVGIRRKNQRNI